jgi:hypothetical protein
LDLILTNIGSYYQKPKKLSPFGLSDHAMFPKVSIKTKSRDLRPVAAGFKKIPGRGRRSNPYRS